MDMQHVRYFLALCEEQSFTRAAKRCQVSQPSLSAAIRRLEEEFGGSLFRRGKNATTLSPLGLAVRPYLQQIDRSADDAKRIATNLQAFGSVSTLKIMEQSMRKIVYGAAIAASVLLVAVVVNRQPRPATASIQTQANDIVNVRALESNIDATALPRQTVDYVD